MDSPSLSALLSTQRRGVTRSMWRYVLRSSGWNMEHYFCTPTIWAHSEQKLGSSSGRWVEYSVHLQLLLKVGFIRSDFTLYHFCESNPILAKRRRRHGGGGNPRMGL
ncbi:hypothetical protein RHGRI_021181 [Rhododendron griersonianum]|uniref:Uncharacterized protein n=1 Tax=Rhododendron griersonianum TaxID=479676 RepID=A0AAV6JJ77_9ERIC|nr:hypothetical protein RHGRI_021181 [Rhododendron griersonianum]